MTPPGCTDLLTRTEQRVATDPEFADALLDLVEAPASPAGSFSRSAASTVNQQRRDELRRQFLADALSTDEVRRLLDVRTPQAVHRLRTRGKVIGRQVGNGTWFPAWQFKDGARRPDLDQILATITAFTDDAIAADRIMRLQRDELNGRSIVEALDRPRKAPIAAAILRSLGS